MASSHQEHKSSDKDFLTRIKNNKPLEHDFAAAIELLENPENYAEVVNALPDTTAFINYVFDDENNQSIMPCQKIMPDYTTLLLELIIQNPKKAVKINANQRMLEMNEAFSQRKNRVLFS